MIRARQWSFELAMMIESYTEVYARDILDKFDLIMIDGLSKRIAATRRAPRRTTGPRPLAAVVIGNL